MNRASTTFNLLVAAIGSVLLLTPWLEAGQPQGPAPQILGVERAVQLKYDFVTFDIPGGYYDTLFGINKDGLAIGWYYDSADKPTHSYSFLWRDGQETPTPIDYPGASIVYFGDVNNMGLAFGTIGSGSQTQAAVHDVSTKAWTLLPDVKGKNQNQARRMNNLGTGVGQACDGNWWHNAVNCVGWIWDGKKYSYTTLPGTDHPWTGPLAINDQNQVVGQYYDADKHTHAYLQEQSGITSLDVPGASDTYVNAVNNYGEILLDGFFAGGANTNYIREKDGTLTPLPMPSPDAVNTYAYGLNDNGDYCGRWYDVKGESHPFAAYRH